eukprot:1446764-Rhodomonas_salina.2
MSGPASVSVSVSVRGRRWTRSRRDPRLQHILHVLREHARQLQPRRRHLLRPAPGLTLFLPAPPSPSLLLPLSSLFPPSRLLPLSSPFSPPPPPPRRQRPPPPPVNICFVPPPPPPSPDSLPPACL